MDIQYDDKIYIEHASIQVQVDLYDDKINFWNWQINLVRPKSERVTAPIFLRRDSILRGEFSKDLTSWGVEDRRERLITQLQVLQLTSYKYRYRPNNTNDY